MSRGVNVLFVTWDGPYSTYLEGLFLPSFAALQSHGFHFHVLQFTWADEPERERIAHACRALGISYRSASIWRRPVGPGSLATAVFGRTHVRRAIRELGIGLLMPRSTLPAMAALPVAGKVPVLLDADGLPHDERVEFQGASPNGALYRLLRRLEAWSVRRADAVAVRTKWAAKTLAERAGVGAERFHVVANARDAQRFQLPTSKQVAARRADLGLTATQPLVVYVGSSLSGKYLGAPTLQFFREVLRRRPDARLLSLMPRHDEARALLADNPELASACLLRSATPDEVPGWIGAADLGLALIRSTFSMQAASAIKLGEYLLCGVPALVTAGVGESEEVVTREVGRCLRQADSETLAAAADWFVDVVLPDREGFRSRCRAAGVAHFSLDRALQRYEEALSAALRARSG